ncbi:MAG: hypothetical protein CMJ23_08440 [Phycisphaerae bacterium]|nr:hypothetical protein [Phycisphaerae bacterium]
MIRTHSNQGTRRAARGFSLIELLLAIFILGVGVISVAAVFPAGIIQQRRAQDDVLGPVVAESALSILRSKVSQDDFGSFEEFGVFQPQVQEWTDSGISPTLRNLDLLDASTQFGDWPWLRPSMCVFPATGPPLPAVVQTSYGDIDVFSSRYVRSSSSNPGSGSNDWPSSSTTTEFVVDGNPLAGPQLGSDAGAFLYGIPFNRRRFGFAESEVEPRITITQEERCWPAGTGFETVAAVQGGPDQFPAKPQYVWDCMFRRFQGRVQVAIFVYRVIGSGGETYRATGSGFNFTNPPLPARLDLPLRGALGGYEPLTPQGDAEYGPAFVPGTRPSLADSDVVLDPVWDGWQSPGQWLLDPSGRIHRVVQGRRTGSQGPVRLARPIPTQGASSSIVSPSLVVGQDDWVEKASEVRSIWFVPPADRRGVSLEPVYVTVREI